TAREGPAWRASAAPPAEPTAAAPASTPAATSPTARAAGTPARSACSASAASASCERRATKVSGEDAAGAAHVRYRARARAHQDLGAARRAREDGRGGGVRAQRLPPRPEAAALRHVHEGAVGGAREEIEGAGGGYGGRAGARREDHAPHGVGLPRAPVGR